MASPSSKGEKPEKKDKSWESKLQFWRSSGSHHSSEHKSSKSSSKRDLPSRLADPDPRDRMDGLPSWAGIGAIVGGGAGRAEPPNPNQRIEEMIHEKQFEKALEDFTLSRGDTDSCCGGQDSSEYSWQPGAFFAVGLQSEDKVRLIGGPASLIPTLRDALSESWPKGVDKEDHSAQGVWQFRLHGLPWICQDTSGRSRVLKAVLQSLYAEGYRVITTSGQFSEHSYDKASWILKVDRRPTKVGRFFVMEVAEQDRLKLVDLPGHMVTPMLEFLQANWAAGIAKARDSEEPDREEEGPVVPLPLSHVSRKKPISGSNVAASSTRRTLTIRLKGSPFGNQGGNDLLRGFRLRAALLQELSDRWGFTVYATHGLLWVLRSDSAEAMGEGEGRTAPLNGPRSGPAESVDRRL